MAISVTNTEQLSMFPLVRDAILSNETLKLTFNKENILEYEPLHKGNAFRNFPYIWINVPSTQTEKLVIDGSTTMKDFVIDIFLRIEWMARDKFRGFAEALIFSIESTQDVFESSGYFDPKIELISTDPGQVLDQKNIVEGIFELSFMGVVER